MRITLALALLKGDKLSEVVRRGTELGVARFVTFVARRGEVPAVSPAKLARWRRVAEEAAKQSGRSLVPEIVDAVPLDRLELGAPLIVAQPGAASTLAAALAAVAGEGGAPPRELTLLTGPEGGLSDEEAGALEERGAALVRLGPRILRAETAPIALAAAVLLPEAR